MAVLNVDIIVNDNGTLAIKKYTDEAKKAESANKSLATSTKGVSSAFSSLSATIGTISVGLLAREYAKVSDTFTLLEARIKLVTKASEDLANVQQQLFNISQQNKVAYASVGTLYARIVEPLNKLGYSTQNAINITNAFSKALLISGASVEESNSAIRQFSQAMASGVLRGDEFNSMAENSPRLMKALSDSLGVTSGELRQMAQDGKLTADILAGALLDSFAKIKDDAKTIPLTIGGTFQQMYNNIGATIEEINKVTGSIGFITSGIQKADEAVNLFLKGWGYLFTGISLGIDATSIQFNKFVETIKKESLEFDRLFLSKVPFGDYSKEISQLDVEIAQSNVVLSKYDIQLADINLNFAEYVERVNKGSKAQQDLNKDVKATVGSLEDARMAFQRAEKMAYIPFNPSEEQIKEAQAKQKKAIAEAEKLQEDWAKRKLDISYEISIAEQDALSRPYIELQKEYEKDLKEFANIQGAKELLTKEYNAKVEALNKKTIEDFTKLEEEKAKKSAEWQVKLFEANEKLNEQLLAQNERMYGATSEAQIEAWYQNQLEWLGKLALEGKATSEELQGLLSKINDIRELKTKEQTLNFKIEKSFYDSFESNLADSIEDAFNGDLNFKKFFKNIGNDLLSTFSKGLSTTLTGGSSTNLLKGLSTLAVGSSVSAAEIGNIMNSGGTFDSASNAITTAGGSIIKLDPSGAGTVSKGGSDLMSLMSTVSSLKTAYSVLTNGISGTLMSPFNALSGGLGSLGFGSAGTWVNQFGSGFTNPLSMSGESALAGSSTGLGAVAGSAALGYGMGSIGDMIFGAKTKAGTLGAIGAAVGSIVPGIGTLIGGAIGSVLGGFFGSTKATGSGLSFGETTGSGQGFDSIQSYIDYKKKSWFSSKSWTDYTDLSATDKAKIEGIFNAYDYLLTQLGETERITLAAGKYSGETFSDQLSKNFISIFTDISQSTDDTIYQTWKDYAESIDKTVLEALTDSVSTFIQSKRDFELWSLGDSIEALAKKAEWAQADFESLENMVGVTGLTVENFLSEYDKAVKENFTPETITQWDALGDALMNATDASKAYETALNSTTNAVEKQIEANKRANEKAINSIFESFELVGLTTAQTFTQLTGIDAPKTIKEWEEVGATLAKQSSLLTNEVLTAFQNIGLEIKASIEATKTLSNSLIYAGDILGSVANSMKLSELKYADFTKEDGSFNAGAFNIAYEDEKAKLTLKALSETSTNALKIQNAFQSFTDAYSTLPQFDRYNPVTSNNWAGVRQEFSNITENLTALVNDWVDYKAFNMTALAYPVGGQGIADIFGARYNASKVSKSRQVGENTMYGDDVIALYDTYRNLDMALKNNKISAEEYTDAMKLIEAQSNGTIEMLYDYEEQQRRMIAAQEAIYTAAVNSSKYYFSEIVKASDGLQIAAQELGTSVGVVVQTVGRLASLTDVLKFSADNIGFIDKDSVAIKEMSYLISDASKFLSAQLTTADAKQAAETLAQKESFANVDALNLRNLSLMFEGLSAYDSTAMENLFTQLNAYLIKGDITDAQYVDVFNTALDVYRDGNDINEKQLETLKTISSMVSSISDYQRDLLLGDLSTMDSASRYTYALQETMSVAQQAKDAMALGDIDKFTDLFESYKQVSTDFLELSQSLSANNDTYMNDFTKVYSALEEMKTLATTGSANAIAPLSQDYFKLDGSHASGLDYVPFDGYVAELHKGERVQTASQATQNDNVAQEIKALREDLKTANSALAQHMAKTAKILDRWEGDGMPEVRTA